MPKKSKITMGGSRSNPGAASKVKEQPEKFFCTRCTRKFSKQKGNFPASQSPMFAENNGHLPVCKHCVDEMFAHYKAVLGDEKRAIYRICLHFDIYWSERVYDILSRSSTTVSRVLAYISKANLQQFLGKTFDDTLDEEEHDRIQRKLGGAFIIEGDEVRGSSDEDNVEEAPEPFVITQEMVDFWGGGLDPAFYRELENRKKYWCGDSIENMDVGEVAVIKQICMLEVTINRDSAAGKAIDRSVNALNSLLGSANLKPVQKKDDSMDGDTTPFGVWIRKIENTRPISEVDPDFQDVDGIRKYISVWFFGHLCKMLKIKNRYSRLYEEELAKLRVDRPEYDGEDEETILEDIFDRASKDGEPAEAEWTDQAADGDDV